MPYSSFQKNGWLNTWRNVSFVNTATYGSLHTGDPGDSGTSEVSGGTPAYIRKVVTWNAAAAGAMDDSNAPVFDVPASTTVAYVGFWSAVTVGTFFGAAD